MIRPLASVGTINNPYRTLNPGSPLAGSVSGSGLIILLTTLFRTAIVVAGIYALLNFVMAGYQFIQAGGEPKSIAKAWERIWQSILGLVVVAGALVLAAIVSRLVFGDATLIIHPRVFAP